MSYEENESSDVLLAVVLPLAYLMIERVSLAASRGDTEHANKGGAQVIDMAVHIASVLEIDNSEMKRALETSIIKITTSAIVVMQKMGNKKKTIKFAEHVMRACVTDDELLVKLFDGRSNSKDAVSTKKNSITPDGEISDTTFDELMSEMNNNNNNKEMN